ncbi:unnamed protein product [Ectocarpus sp. CCAP 1310/34]|nr:unnamed protein product [Ectocarpus sp. CCAP 1310/34]
MSSSGTLVGHGLTLSAACRSMVGDLVLRSLWNHRAHRWRINVGSRRTLPSSSLMFREVNDLLHSTSIIFRCL